MPAKSVAQQRLAAIALNQPNKLKKKNKGMAKMKPGSLREFASTPLAGLPQKVPTDQGF